MNTNRKDYMLKRNGKPIGDAPGQNGEGEPLQFRENDRINAQIDTYIKENPRHWEQIKTMPRERLERTVVWQQLRYNQRSQKLNDGLLRKLDEDPQLKQDCDNLLKHVPEDRREAARVRIARTLVLSKGRTEKQAKNGVAV